MFNTNFDYLINEYMVYCRSRQLRAKTLNSYEQALRLFERWCKEQMSIDDVAKITDSVIRRYINDLQERGKYTFYCNDKGKEKNFPDRRRDFRKPVSVCTINNYIRDLRAFFNWLDCDYVLKKNPMKKIRQLKANRQAKEYISDEDFKRLTNALDKSYFPEHRDFAMIMLMIDSGMRLGECSCLLLDDVDLARKQILLRADITKGRKDRVVFFSPKTENLLRRWLQFKDRYVETDYMFPIKSTGAHIDVNGFESNFKHYCRRVGLSEDITPHCLRNNFAKRCLMNGIAHERKISFFYTRHSAEDITKTENRRKGQRYVVSPYKVVLSEGKKNHSGVEKKMIEEERIRKKKEEKEKGFWETFISSLLEKCAAAAIQVAFDNIFG